jgi:hypothetical protein
MAAGASLMQRRCLRFFAECGFAIAHEHICFLAVFENRLCRFAAISPKAEST